MRIKKAVTLLIFASMFWTVCAVSQDKMGIPEQLQFSAEDDSVKNPVAIPSDAWSILKSDPGVLEVLANRGLSVDQLPASWFTASEIHLDGRNESDLVVVGKGPLQGANVTTFWVFLRQPQGLKLVLNAPAHDLIIKPTRQNGYKTIEIASATAVRLSKTTFQFDGNQYRAEERSAPKSH
jgi:hypothetical protein